VITYRIGISNREVEEVEKGGNMVTPEQERIAKIVLDAAFEVHSRLGPGLLESAYQTCLLYELKERGLYVESEKPLPIVYKSIHLDLGFLFNFNVRSFKDGIKRIVLNDKNPSSTSST
jgi:hypothetical protein